MIACSSSSWQGHCLIELILQRMAVTPAVRSGNWVESLLRGGYNSILIVIFYATAERVHFILAILSLVSLRPNDANDSIPFDRFQDKIYCSVGPLPWPGKFLFLTCIKGIFQRRWPPSVARGFQWLGGRGAGSQRTPGIRPGAQHTNTQTHVT